MVFGLRVERGNGERRYLSYGFFPAAKPLVHRDFLSKASKRKPRIHLVRPATHQLVGVNIQGRQRKRLPAQTVLTPRQDRAGQAWLLPTPTPFGSHRRSVDVYRRAQIAQQGNPKDPPKRALKVRVKKARICMEKLCQRLFERAFFKLLAAASDAERSANCGQQPSRKKKKRPPGTGRPHTDGKYRIRVT